MSKLYVYVSGPISKGDMFVNCRNAILAGEELRAAGLHPYVPHLSCTWQMIVPVAYEAWMELDLAWIERCNVLLRLPGESSGADREAAHAKSLGQHIFHSVAEVIDWAKAAGYIGRPAGAGRERETCPNWIETVQPVQVRCLRAPGHADACGMPTEEEWEKIHAG